MSEELQPEQEMTSPERARKTTGFVRWRVFLPIFLLIFVFEFFLGGKTLAYVTQMAGKQALAVDVVLKNTDLSLTRGKIEYQDVDAARSGKSLVALAGAEVNLNMTEVMRGSIVIDETRVSAPTLRWVKAKSGKVDLDGAKDEAEKELMKRLQDEDFIRSKLREMKEQYEKYKEGFDKNADTIQEAAKKLDQNYDPLLDGRATYAEKRPLFWLKRAVCEGLVISIEDELKGSKPLKLENGQGEMRHFTSHPERISEPLSFQFKANLANAPGSEINVLFGHDLKTDIVTIQLALKGIPLDWIDPYWATSMPLQFNTGTLGDLSVKIQLQGNKIEAKPRIALHNCNTQVRNPDKTKKIAGVNAEQLAKSMTRVRSVVLSDIRIHGTLDNPQIEFGNTLQNLVVEGAAAMGREQAKKGMDKLEGKANKGLDKLDKKFGKKFGKKLEKHGIDTKQPSDVINKVTGGTDGNRQGANDTLDKVEKGSKKLIGGLLNGNKDKKTEADDKNSNEKKDKDSKDKDKKKKGGLVDDVKKGIGGLFGN